MGSSMEYILKFVLLIILHTSVTDADVYKIDVTTFDRGPLVETSSAETYRTFLSSDYKTASFDKIGRYEDTGTGDVGSGHENPQDNDDIIPQGRGFPPQTKTNIDINGNKILDVKFSSTQEIGRIGIFYTTVSKDGATLTIPTIKMSESAVIKPVKYTSTFSIGDTAHLSIITSKSTLRWVHNNSTIITQWNDKTNVTIDNVRLADAGIYECYEEGMREHGKHAIMRLIVRECPSPKYGADCSNTCNTCWNGGICAADDGTCLCQPGFKGTFCGTRCGGGTWGAFCTLGCSDGCVGRLICGPDPIGCSCVANYMGLNCNEPCPDGRYGANCDLKCHCSDDLCDQAIGCKGTCDDGFGINTCQGHLSCETGFYGDQCQHQCHCLEGAACNKTTGVCSNNGSCAAGWAGNDCQQALPALFHDPRILSIDGVKVDIDWDDWNQMIDYGNGPVEAYSLYYGIKGSVQLMTRVESRDSNITLLNLQPDTEYEFAVAAIKSVEGVMEEGTLGHVITGSTQCLEPTKHPNFTKATVIGRDSVILEWTIPEGDEWFQCSNLSDFIITYRQNDSSSYNEKRVPSTDLSVTISALTLCTIYKFEIRATNKHAQGINSPPVHATTFIAPGNITSLKATPLSPASINIQWTAPSQSVCNVTDYIVYHNLTLLDQCLEMSNHATNLTTATSLTLHNLEYFSSYDISVQARSGDKGGPTEQTYVETEETVPTGQPENVTGSSSIEQQLTYTWDPPTCGKRHGIIVLYEYQFGKNVFGGSYTLFSTTSTNLSFTGLSHNTLYEFRVRANTTLGAGPYTGISASRTQESGSFDNITAAAVSVSVVLLVMISIVLGAVLFLKRRGKNDLTSSETGKHEHSSNSSESEVPNFSARNAREKSILAVVRSNSACDEIDHGYQDIDIATLDSLHSYEELGHVYLEPMTQAMTSARNQDTDGYETVIGKICTRDSET